MKDYHCVYCGIVVLRAEVGSEIRKGAVHICNNCFHHYCRDKRYVDCGNDNDNIDIDIETIQKMFGMQ